MDGKGRRVAPDFAHDPSPIDPDFGLLLNERAPRGALPVKIWPVKILAPLAVTAAACRRRP
ncbi:hypothetical protein BQ8794_220092 [Mesorhizobium prunaredense]|uniref:Uncharacterized protein n=1 Tax=Mesorhizobium prunaredense TaxID=1631249 RepID=A0A1R3V6L5_9HYPH|nr:hypothetical protein BQ8794_220092 [Mesorhizobium prunaredense]